MAPPNVSAPNATLTADGAMERVIDTPQQIDDAVALTQLAPEAIDQPPPEFARVAEIRRPPSQMTTNDKTPPQRRAPTIPGYAMT